MKRTMLLLVAMKGITGPAADVVYNAVSSTVTLQGTEEVAPRNDQEWEAVEDSAAALVESGNLMLARQNDNSSAPKLWPVPTVFPRIL